MPILIALALSAVFSIDAFAARAPKPKPTTGGCGTKITTDKSNPLGAFYAKIESTRADGLAPLHNLLRNSEFLASLAPSLLHSIAGSLIDPREKKHAARYLIDRAMKITAGGNPGGSMFAPVFRTVQELEQNFDPARVVELAIARGLVDDVRAGRHVSTIRTGHRWQVKTGPGVLRVAGSDERFPIRITSVRFIRAIHELTEADLKAQGPHVANVFDHQGEWAALDLMANALRSHYPEYAEDDDLTVVHFEVEGP